MCIKLTVFLNRAHSCSNEHATEIPLIGLQGHHYENDKVDFY